MIDDILDELNLSIYKERHPMSLSGGQKQRTAIGVAALRDSEVIILTNLPVDSTIKHGKCRKNIAYIGATGKGYFSHLS